MCIFSSGFQHTLQAKLESLIHPDSSKGKRATPPNPHPVNAEVRSDNESVNISVPNNTHINIVAPWED